MVAIAASLWVSGADESLPMIAARAAAKALLISGSLSLARARFSTAASELWSCDLNTESAALMRFAGSGDERLMAPCAASRALRTALLRRTCSRNRRIDASLPVRRFWRRKGHRRIVVIDRVRGRIEQKPVGGQRFENGRCRGETGFGEFLDRRLRVGKFVGRKARQRIVDRIGTGGHGADQEAAPRENADKATRKSSQRAECAAMRIEGRRRGSVAASDLNVLAKRDSLIPASFDEGGPERAIGRSGRLLRSGRAAALACLDIEVAAGQRLAPIGDEILGAFEIIGPFIAGNEAGGLPDHVELAVCLNFADEDGLGDVVIGHHRRIAAGEVGNGDADHRVDDRVGIRRAGRLRPPSPTC